MHDDTRDAEKVAGMSPNGCNDPGMSLSLDDMAAEVRRLCSEEAAAQDEARILSRLFNGAATRQEWAAELRRTAERRMRDAYNEALKP